MEVPGSSSTISEKQPRKQEGLSNTRTDSVKQSLISSEEWLQLHGLKSNKLTLKQILSQIGFPHCEDYVVSLGRLVASRYANGLFPRIYTTEDGRVYNLTAKSELISQYMEHLTQAVESYKQRMDWLTSNSRQIFGVILEQCITIVLDFGGMLEEELNLCRDALTMVLQEQVAHIAKFNVIWVSQEPVKWQENAVPVTAPSIAAAISWVEKLPFELASSHTSRLEALLEAGKDEVIESIYYFVVGDVPEESKELLLQQALEIPCPVCTVSFNARGQGTIAFLKDLSAKTFGRFHAFAERTECVEFPAFPIKDGDSVITWNSRKLKGKLPPGIWGVREDVFLIWREMEEAGSTLAQMRRLVAETPKTSVATTDHAHESNPEDTWDSEKWLQKYGLKAQKLSFYDVIADCSFRHADGVVDIKSKPGNESVQTSAETNRKTVHAKYCGRFIHAPWKDGSLVHVCITKEKYMWFSERVHAALAQIQRRIKWLQDGSRGLFGKVPSDCVYILIDTSHSMTGKLDLVKNKVIQLIQEQLKHKKKFNFVQFDAQASAWQEKLVEINEDNLKGAQAWIRDIKIGSSTNTLSALQIAFADEETQVIYLLTDGRPDQVLIKVGNKDRLTNSLKKIPIYAISFCYNDEIADGFLKDLASLTGGEFHSYNFGWKDPCTPEAVQNEDLTLLIKEMEQGRNDLEKVQGLYSESLVMDWWYNAEKDGDNEYFDFTRPGLLCFCLICLKTSQSHVLSSAEMSSATWLKIHGLAAKKLTIMDALSMAAIPHSSTYVPVLDKHVVSKVFDEVFPLAHVCNDTNKMTLINPQGVKLNIYKQKVEQAIKSYEKLDANKPMRYLENKAALNEALERLNWPISLKELSLLENEILAGKMYVQQAMELQEAVKKENYVSKALEEQQKIQGIPTKKNKSKKLDPLRGQKVIARCDENGFYFPGVVKKCVSPTHALVGFRYGDTKVVPISFITPVGGAMPCPLLQVGDYVFAKIVIPKGFDFYVPAIVIALPNQDMADSKFYTVLKCNNRREFCPRSALIKISQNKYALSCSHINSPPIQEDSKVEDMDTKNSSLLVWPIKEVNTGDLQATKQENPRRKKKKASKRLPLQEVVSSDSDDSSRGNRSRDSHPKRHPKPKLGGGHHVSQEHPEVSLKDSACELTPQFPGQFRPQHSKISN
ncbi:hypothetical protein MJG53_020547, partial [Ovis ammon polii x Ovis aries]